jgi:hypothetical protein
MRIAASAKYISDPDCSDPDCSDPDFSDRRYFGSAYTSLSHLLSRRVRSADDPYLAKS